MIKAGNQEFSIGMIFTDCKKAFCLEGVDKIN